MNKVTKRGQEEMVGFALIMVLVMVILVIFIGFMMVGEREGIESYEVQSFLGAMLDTTTQCENYYGKLSVGDLIQDCYHEQEATCLDGKKICEVLERTMKEITESDPKWRVGPEYPKKGYELLVVSEEEEPIFNISLGDLTGEYDFGWQALYDLDITLQAYY